VWIRLIDEIAMMCDFKLPLEMELSSSYGLWFDPGNWLKGDPETLP